MPAPEAMRAAVDEYVAAFAAGDAERVVALFAPDAVVEDPVGQSRLEGHDAIRAFYAGSMQTGAKLELQGPVRCAAETCAFAFGVYLDMAGRESRIDVIDVFRFGSDGKVVEMRAYWGPTDMHAL